jgi:hypothetical protein
VFSGCSSKELGEAFVPEFDLVLLGVWVTRFRCLLAAEMGVGIGP